MTWAAVIAAMVSVAAAIISYRAQLASTDGARRIASTQHQVSAHDHRVEQFREDYRDFLRSSFGALSNDEQLRNAMISASEVLKANPLTRDALCRAVSDVTQNLLLVKEGAASQGFNLGDVLDGCRLEFTAILVATDAERDSILQRRN